MRKRALQHTDLPPSAAGIASFVNHGGRMTEHSLLIVDKVTPSTTTERSIFDDRPVESFHDEIREIYLADKRPWVIGYSGGKDSTATLQLI